MLEVPLEWNEVPDMIIEDKDFLPEAEGSTKGREMKSPKGRENVGRKMISGLRNIRPQCLGEHKIQRGSILKIGMKFSKKKTNGQCQIIYRWCFAAEV